MSDVRTYRPEDRCPKCKTVHPGEPCLKEKLARVPPGVQFHEGPGLPALSVGGLRVTGAAAVQAARVALRKGGDERDAARAALAVVRGLAALPAGEVRVDRWCVLGDGDGHTYLVPAGRRGEALAALERCGRYWASGDDEWRAANEADAELPDWMRQVRGAELLTFTDPRDDA
jgi:hypothetical protein